MKKSSKKNTKDISTEERIKDAARAVFHKKGYAATRTRDIAEESGINLALLNYYFRSKAKLFEIIMVETMSSFFQSVLIVLNNKETSLQEKIEDIASRYIDLIIKEPEIPGFILSEVRSNPLGLMEKIPLREIAFRSVFFQQYKEAVDKGEIKVPNPLHFLFNLMGMIVFPFIAKPMIMGSHNMENEEFNQLMTERKRLIPVWINTILTSG